ncbi:thioredoxin domain-containing protein [Candidatus Saccharibacteria bacterium]|nr:thioredoxin domain-containing protein [Candidatus Saccharibacteria bacterium]NIV03294.1 thioredoxin domain-containing protein [Calditrichia bacterium]NIS37815.1 thioredoxin domain-containing protein [Candidatus Saccharibacteria bacterium]NIV71470.1 thioredoxin domain-containing protein [Calditrichia bacterium]NIV98008.1 thioredoxin domain-containing protein [Candidatus Saccharibacteria bacterium]
MEQRLTKKERRELKRREKVEREIVQKSKKRFWRNVYVVAGVIVVVLVILGVRVMLSKDVEEVARATNDPVKGSLDAKVVIREYSDFECPACRTSALALGKAVSGYSDEELGYVYNDYPIIQLHKNAYEASLAAQCAYKQDEFWEYHDRLFLDQTSWKDLENPRDKFISYATALELDVDLFTICLDEEQTKGLVEEDLNEARDLRMNSTPTYFVNGIRYVGAKSEEGWRELIDSYLE